MVRFFSTGSDHAFFIAHPCRAAYTDALKYKP
jgi:hypothetical protein